MSQPFPPNEGPRAPERNPPIRPDYYAPRVFYITAIATGPTTTITTSEDHDYVIGQIIRLIIPPTYGAFPLSGQQGQVISIPALDQVIVTIDSKKANAFIASPTYGPTRPQIIPVGDVNTGVQNGTFVSSLSGTTAIPITGTFIPGSFIDISPA